MRCSATVLPTAYARCCCSECLLVPTLHLWLWAQQHYAATKLRCPCPSRQVRGTASACRCGKELVQRRRAPRRGGLCIWVRPSAARARRPRRRVRQRLRRPLRQQRRLRHAARALRLVQLPLPAAPIQPAWCEAGLCATHAQRPARARTCHVCSLTGASHASRVHRRHWPRL